MAVVGTSFGCRIHLPALRAAGFDVVALVGRDPDRTARRAERFGVPASATTLGRAISLGAQAVTIATPPATHYRLARRAIDAGLHVLVEKPFTLDAAEAEELLRAATGSGVVHLVGFEFRWAVGHALAERALGSGSIGVPGAAAFVQWTPFLAGAADGKDAGGRRMPDWWFDPSKGGGWLAASGSHALDQVRTWLGDIESVSAGLSVLTNRPPGSAEDTFSARLRTRSGCEVVLQQTAAARGASGAPPLGAGIAAVAGTEGTLWLNGEEVWVADGRATQRLEVPPELRLPEPAGFDPEDPRHAYSHLELPPYTRLAEHFRIRIEGSAVPPGPLGATFSDGLESMRVLEALRASASAGGALVKVRPGG